MNVTKLRSELGPLARRTDEVPDEFAHMTPAAVLLPLYLKVVSGTPQWYVLFTKRTDTLRHHKGQISFPGGKFDTSDLDLKTTALRETHEEVGIHPKDVTLWGSLPPMPTINDYYIFPFVGEVPHPYEYCVNEAEIDTLIHVPLAHLKSPEWQRTDQKEYLGQTISMHYFDYEKWTIWGITGHITNNFLNLI